MRLPRPFYRLPVRFDAERLRAEVDALPASAWAAHPTGFAGNASLRLISSGGGENDDLRGPMAPTPHLQACPYVRQVLGSFGVVWGRSRLMRLAPGARVPEHADASWHWYNRVRMHVPIRTHPDVRFHCDGVAAHMAAGEAWIFDNWRRHHVDNDSDVERIHLVADTSGTAAFWSLVARSDAAAASPRWIPYDARRDVQVVVERTPPRPVMAPAEVELLLNDFVGELVAAEGQGPATDALQQWIGLLNGFTCDWRQLYLLHGEAPDPNYGQLRDSLRAALGPLAAGLVMATNRSPALAVLESRLLQHLLDPRHEAETQDSQRSSAARASSQARSAAAEPAVSASRPATPPRPLFIIAAPRSGSTLLFETLAVSPQFCTLGGEAHWLVEQFAALRPGAPGVDSNRLEARHASPDLAAAMTATIWPRLLDPRRRPLASADAARLRWLEKTPKNALRVSFLHALFPAAQFVLLWRDPRPNVASIVQAWRAGGWVTYPALPDWPGPWSMLLPPGYAAMRGRSLHEIAAWQWDQANATALHDLLQLPPASWTVLRYEELTADPVQAVRGLCEFAGVVFDRELRERTDAPLPASRHTLTAPAADKWRVHARELEAALPLCCDTWARLQSLDAVTRRSENRIAR